MKASSPDRGAEAGYNLVVLIVAITVLNVLVAAMLPLWSTAIRREKEEELVFRGFQYAEAIRIFHQRFQRYPNKLEELIELKPRSIRQLWKDPMTEDGKWALIFQNGPEPVQRQPGGSNPQKDGEEQSTEDQESDAEGRPQFGPRKGETVQIGPIVGVHSKSGKKSMLVLFGRERYDEWRFTEDILTGAMGSQRGSIEGNPAVGNPGQSPTVNLSTRWLGRPMRFVNQSPALPPDGTMPDGQPPGRARNKPPPRGSSKRP
jgi:type II secretory pathway pseudopilin PulG